jgi:5-(carboxyamino)imidazole ribonucleotide synthase
VETLQENGVCNLVQYPATVSPNIKAQIEFYLERLIAGGLIGIFNFEFFVDENNRVLINEGAPRTHNSQHLTIDASSNSQFELLALYLTDPTHAPRKVSTLPSIMVNILGKSNGEYGELKIPEVFPLKITKKLYGKKTSSPGRKMGHVNVVDEAGRADLVSLGKKILEEYEL